MAAFDLKQYETVAERLPRFLADHPDARIITINLTTDADREVLTWIMRAEIHVPIDPKDLTKGWYLKSTGHAFEIDGQGGMANKTSALENCETSAIGRALANAGYGGDRRVTREEMEKVERGVTPKKDWIALAQATTNKDELREVYNKARRAGATTPELTQIAEVANKWTQEVEPS